VRRGMIGAGNVTGPPGTGKDPEAGRSEGKPRHAGTRIGGAAALPAGENIRRGGPANERTDRYVSEREDAVRPVRNPGGDPACAGPRGGVGRAVGPGDRHARRRLPGAVLQAGERGGGGRQGGE